MASVICVVCGVSGSGKSSVVRCMASRNTDVTALEGDDYHTEANKLKMSNGAPLTDKDRMPWLRSVARAAVLAARGSHESQKVSQLRAGRVVALSCSVLSAHNRSVLLDEIGQASSALDETMGKTSANPIHVAFVQLVVSREVLQERLASRYNHFFNPGLLSSQLDAFEAIRSEERIANAISIVTEPDTATSRSADDIASTALQFLTELRSP